jgi:hypothetical protein
VFAKASRELAPDNEELESFTKGIEVISGALEEFGEIKEDAAIVDPLKGLAQLALMMELDHDIPDVEATYQALLQAFDGFPAPQIATSVRRLRSKYRATYALRRNVYLGIERTATGRSPAKEKPQPTKKRSERSATDSTKSSGQTPSAAPSSQRQTSSRSEQTTRQSQPSGRIPGPPPGASQSTTASEDWEKAAQGLPIRYRHPNRHRLYAVDLSGSRYSSGSTTHTHHYDRRRDLQHV